MNKNVHRNCFNQFKSMAQRVKTKEDLRVLEKQFRRNIECFGEFKVTIDAFFDAKYLEFKKNDLALLIRPIEEVNALEFNLKGLNKVEHKIKNIKDVKLKNGFKGVFNLLNERSNLVYNDLKTRQEVIDDLNVFKSLNYFKMAYVSPFDLKSDYKYLSYRNGAIKFYSQIIPIEHGLFVLKTMEHDGLTLKAFYINNKVKILTNNGLKRKNVLKDDKFNLTSTDAFKSLNKEDSIRYYNYCNNNGLDRKNRALLRSIRKMEGGESFSCHLENVEAIKSQLEEDYASNPTITLENGSIIPNYELANELDAITKEYWSLTEEHNSESAVTTMEDY